MAGQGARAYKLWVKEKRAKRVMSSKGFAVSSNSENGSLVPADKQKMSRPPPTHMMGRRGEVEADAELNYC